MYLCTEFYIPAIYYYTIYLNYINNLLLIYIFRLMCFSNNSRLIRRTRNRHLRHQLHIYNHNRNSNRNNSSTSNHGRRDRHQLLWTNSHRTWLTLFSIHLTRHQTLSTTCICREYPLFRNSPILGRIPWWPPVKCTNRTINHSSPHTELR